MFYEDIRLIKIKGPRMVLFIDDTPYYKLI